MSEKIGYQRGELIEGYATPIRLITCLQCSSPIKALEVMLRERKLTNCPFCDNVFHHPEPEKTVTPPEVVKEPLLAEQFSPLNEKFVKKYMRMAKQYGEDSNACYSRQIGTVLVKVYQDGTSRVVSTGYNSPPKKTPHTDSHEYLNKLVWPQLTWEEKVTAIWGKDCTPPSDELHRPEEALRECFLEKSVGCQTCPPR